MSTRQPSSPIVAQYLHIWTRRRTAFLLLLVLSTKWTDGGGITIRPSGPAAGFVEDTSFNLTCFSSRPGNVTWALPVHSSDELDNIQIKDLQKRAHLTTLREGDVFVAVLSVVKAKRSDSGRYTCHPVGVDPVDLKAQSETFPCVHIFISWKGAVGVELNPLKSVYVVGNPSQQLFVVPCFNYFPSQHFSMVDLALQKRKLPQIGSPDTLWESVDLSAKSYFNWSFADYRGIAIRHPKSGEYRCGAVTFNSTCPVPKWSLYSFFIVQESVEKEAVEDDKDQRPRIRPTSTPFLIFPSGSTFSLFCKTDALAAHQWNVNWRLPFAFHNDDYDTAQVKNLGQRVVATLAKANGKSSQSDYSVLTITNASHLDTGYYTCHRADNDSNSVRQYVFIQDWNALVAAPLNKYLEFGKEEAMIGCRPTHPSVQMSLERIADDGTPVTVYSPAKDSNKDMGDWSYNVFEGFKYTKRISWETEGTYLCVGRKNYLEGPSRHRSAVVTHELYLRVRGIELTMSFSDGNKAGTIAEGDAVQLTCRSQEWQQQDRDNLPNLTWHWTRRDEQNVSVTLELGSGPGPDGVGRIAESTRRNGYGLSHLSWTNISSQAAGTYKCTHQQSGVSASYILAVSTASDGQQLKNGNSRLLCGLDSLFTAEGMWFLTHIVVLLKIY
ncbi:uncharacterized protein LOC124336945 isoform X2 [Daphnia pulicaria]|uniref:uncharacterized protein LOC124336945 isoform X2 n=1 Tax=Daphnia pulicaria TaxID=35523 RepID=UPI001EEABDAE|nr:uncharacterized protein LOC124336945 isoform X2 [Daphnia pulicaria]